MWTSSAGLSAAVEEAGEVLARPEDGCMTIATHCIELLTARGPMTAEDLGAACRAAGLTSAKDPAMSVNSALGWASDGRALRIDDHFHLVTSLLDRRWLTMPAPPDPRRFEPGVDLECLLGFARREGIPLATGGSLRGHRFGAWTGPGGWAPAGDFIGLRLVDGIAEVAPVELDEEVRTRGDELAERILSAPDYERALDGGERLVRAVLTLLQVDDVVLREPVPPLSVIFPVPTPPIFARPAPFPAAPPGFSALQIFLPPGLHADLADAAHEVGVGLDRWVVDELARLAAWPSPSRWPIHLSDESLYWGEDGSVQAW